MNNVQRSDIVDKNCSEKRNEAFLLVENDVIPKVNQWMIRVQCLDNYNSQHFSNLQSYEYQQEKNIVAFNNKAIMIL